MDNELTPTRDELLLVNRELEADNQHLEVIRKRGFRLCAFFALSSVALSGLYLRERFVIADTEAFQGVRLENAAFCGGVKIEREEGVVVVRGELPYSVGCGEAMKPEDYNRFGSGGYFPIGGSIRLTEADSDRTARGEGLIMEGPG